MRVKVILYCSALCCTVLLWFEYMKNEFNFISYFNCIYERSASIPVLILILPLWSSDEEEDTDEDEDRDRPTIDLHIQSAQTTNRRIFSLSWSIYFSIRLTAIRTLTSALIAIPTQTLTSALTAIPTGTPIRTLTSALIAIPTRTPRS